MPTEEVNHIFAAMRRVPGQLGIDPTQQAPHKNFQQLPRYEGEFLPEDAIDGGYGLSVMQDIPCRAPGLATPYLEEIQESPDYDYAVILATVKGVAHADAGEGSEPVAPAGVIVWSTVVAMDAAGRVLLVETMGPEPQMICGREGTSKIGVTNHRMVWRVREMQ